MAEHVMTAKETPPIAIFYQNYRGEKTWRNIVPSRMWYGETIWHPAEQWFLDAFDLDRDCFRTFAIADIAEWQVGSSRVPVRQALTCQNS
jgi:predicted DNA-binding transcriptional regulator YafY